MEVNRDEIRYEGNELYLDEIEELLLPSDMPDYLPELLLFETMVFVHEGGTRWFGIVGYYSEKREWYLQVIW